MHAEIKKKTKVIYFKVINNCAKLNKSGDKNSNAIGADRPSSDHRLLSTRPNLRQRKS